MKITFIPTVCRLEKDAQGFRGSIGQICQRAVSLPKHLFEFHPVQSRSAIYPRYPILIINYTNNLKNFKSKASTTTTTTTTTKGPSSEKSK